MKIVKSKNFELVNSFLENNFSSPTHWSDWNLVLANHYKTDFFYYLAYRDEVLIGIFPMHEKKNKFLSEKNSGLYYFIPNGGWIFSEKTTFNFSEFKSNLATKLSVNTLPLIENFNVIYENETVLKETLIISLDQSIERIWETQINSKRRNMIRKAEKSNVVIKSLDQGHIDTFYKYYKVANSKNGIFIQSKEFFIDLLSSANNIKFEILLAYLEDEPIGATVIVYDKDYAFYWLGITIPSKNSGQGELLQWEAIKRVKNSGCKYYDLCYIDEKNLPHIFKFKKGFSSNKLTIANYNKKTLFFKVFNRLLNI